MKSNRPAVFLALLVLTSSAASQPATISWPEAVAQLTGERAKAERMACPLSTTIIGPMTH